jgi:perosamine synthetase
MAGQGLAIEGGEPVRGASDPLPGVFPRDLAPGAYQRVQQVLASGFTSDAIAEFERTFAELHGVKHCVTVCNCTAAVHTAVAACGLGPGDEVVTSPLSDYGSVAGIIWQGAQPVFADVDLRTGNVTAETLAARITPRTKALLVVHFYGLVCDMEPIVELARAHNLLLIEDCCQCPLASYRGREVGTFGDCGCFSFDAEKHLSASTGGALLTNNDTLAARARRFALSRGAVPEEGYGRRHVEAGLNYRWSEVLAAIALAQLHILPEQNRRRAHLAAALTAKLAEVPGVHPPYVVPGTEPTYWLYFLRFELSRFRVGLDEIAAALTAEGLPGGTARYYLIPDSHTFLPDRQASLAAVPNAVEHINSVYRWLWTDRYTQRDLEDIATMVRKVVYHYLR